MKPCDDFRELLGARIDGELSPAETERLNAHLASCEACRRELAGMERVWDGLTAMAEARVPEGLADRVVAKALGSGRTRRFALPRWMWSAAAIAAAVLIAVALGMQLPGEKKLDADTVQIVSDMDLLQDLEVLEHLDTLEQVGDGVLLMSTDQAKTNGSGS